MLSKRNYYTANQVAFRRLTPKQKEDKYRRYVERYRKTAAAVTANAVSPTDTPQKTKKTNNSQLPKQTQVTLSKCLMLYARAAIDPFDNITEMPCIPDNICAPSYKFKTFIDAGITVGSAGIGFAAFNPWTMACNDNAADTTAIDYPVIGTMATYGNDYYGFVPSDVTNTVEGLNSNSPYPYAQIAQGRMRLVAAGLEVEYTGVLLNQSGAISVIQWDGLQPVPNPTSIANIRSNQRTQTCATKKEARCYVRYEPTSSSNYDYSSLSDFRPSTNPALGQAYYPLLVIISGAQPGTTFRIRAISYFELQLSTAPSTPSESDPIGFPALQAARTQVLPTSNPESDLSQVLRMTAYNLKNSISKAAPAIGTAIGATFGNPMLGHSLGVASKDIINSLF